MPYKDALEYVERQKTIANAAAAVQDLAVKAKEMLEQIQTSSWWKLLASPKPKV